MVREIWGTGQASEREHWGGRDELNTNVVRKKMMSNYDDGGEGGEDYDEKDADIHLVCG